MKCIPGGGTMLSTSCYVCVVTHTHFVLSQNLSTIYLLLLCLGENPKYCALRNYTSIELCAHCNKCTTRTQTFFSSARTKSSLVCIAAVSGMGISLVNKTNKRGLSTLPWGVPESGWTVSDFTLFTLTLKLRSVRKLDINLM